MRYDKMDAMLVSQIENVTSCLETIDFFVKIHNKTETAKMTADAIDQLSEQSWVQRMSGSNQSRPLFAPFMA